MNINKKRVNIGAEVILFNDEKVLVLKNGEIQLEYRGKQVIPLYSNGRLINFKVSFEGEKYKSYVIRKDKNIIAIGYVLDSLTEDEILERLNNNDYKIIESHKESDIIVLYFD